MDRTYAQDKSDQDVAAEQRKVEDAVKKAIGFSDAREDSVQVSFVPFNKELLPVEGEAAPEASWVDRGRDLVSLLKIPAALILSVVFLVFGFFRPFLRHLERERQAARQAEARLRTAAELEALGPEGRGAAALLREREKDETVARVEELAKTSPERSAKLIRSWLES